MRHLPYTEVVLPEQQRAIWAAAMHPSGIFRNFPLTEIEQSIPHRFEQQVHLHPDRLAVKTPGHQWTYDELNQEANCIAQAILTQRGVGEEPVVIVLEQGAWLIAAILGPLKAGRIYVPLDPLFPHERLAAMLQHIQTRLIVTNTQQGSVVATLRQGEHQVLNLDALQLGASAANPAGYQPCGARLDVDVPQRVLLETPTIAQMAIVITQHLLDTITPDDLDRLAAEGDRPSGSVA